MAAVFRLFHVPVFFVKIGQDQKPVGFGQQIRPVPHIASMKSLNFQGIHDR
jgi:hypothetical protein